jgi:nucleoside-diphosphate-sugar epimerase
MPLNGVVYTKQTTIFVIKFDYKQTIVDGPNSTWHKQRNHYAKTKSIAEQRVLTSNGRGDLQTCALRLAAVIGRGDMSTTTQHHIYSQQVQNFNILSLRNEDKSV